MGKTSKSAEKKKRQSSEENRSMQESTREDEMFFAEDLPKRRRRQHGGQSLPQHAFRPGPSFNSGSFQTPAAQYAADDIRPGMMQESGPDYPHDRTSRQDERDDPRFSGGMKVNPLYSGDDAIRADDSPNLTREYAHYSEIPDNDDRRQAEWNRQQNQTLAHTQNYPTNQPKSSEYMARNMPRNARSHNIWKYRSDPSAYQTRPLHGINQQQYMNNRASNSGWYESNPATYFDNNARPDRGRSHLDITSPIDSTNQMAIQNGAQSRPNHVNNMHASNQMPMVDRFSPNQNAVNNLSVMSSSTFVQETPVYLPQTTGHAMQYGQQPSNVYMVPPPQMAINRTDNQAFDTRIVDMPAVDNQTFVPTGFRASYIFKIIIRLFSANFIIGDLVMDWIQYAEWTGSSIYLNEGWKKAQEYRNVFKDGVDCDKDEGNDGVVQMYLVSCIFATIFAIFQLVNMVGETLIEIKGSSKKLKGFQMLHGWVESSFATFLEEIPQCLLVIFFNCKRNPIVMPIAIASALAGFFKNAVRVGTCKQKPEPCCDCKVECCAYVIPLPPCCCNVKCSICSTDKGCCNLDIEKYDICTDCFWNRENGCFGEIKVDPQWAKTLYEKGSQIHFIIAIVMIILKCV